MMPQVMSNPTNSIYNTATSLSGGGEAQGDSITVNPQTQGLLNNEINRAYGNNSNELMQGVPQAAQGLLQDTPSQNSMGGGSNPDLQSALQRGSESQVGTTVQNLSTYLNATNPLRQAQYESDAAGNLAKISQLDMNDYMLYNQQQLQQLQLQQAQAAAQQSFLGSLLGVVGTAAGFGLAAATGGLATPLAIGAASAAGLAGGTAAKGVGEAAAGGGPGIPSGPSK